MLSSSHCIIKFMCFRGILRSVSLILQKRWLTKGLQCNRCMVQRHRTKYMVSTKKVACLFFHWNKLKIQQKRIWPFIVVLESQFMTKIILHQRMSLNIRSNSKGTEKKLMRCGNKRALYALIERTILRTILRVFGN